MMTTALRPPAGLWRRAAFVLAVLAGGVLCAFAATMAGLFAPPHARPLALDFDAFWSAAHISVQHGARAAYDNAAIEVFERAHTSMPPQGYLAFYYPPSFLLLCLGFAWLPYTASLAAFSLCQAVLLLPALKRVLGAGWGWAPVLACPGFLMNLLSGQNGGVWAACFALAGLSLDRNPWAAGAWLGLLSCKPQLAVCVPVALVVARRWQAALAAACTATVLAGASLLVLGPGAWAGFLANAPAARADIDSLAVKWPMMQSFYGAMRLAGFSSSAGYGLQITAGVLALALLARICWHRPGAGPEMAALATASLLVTPYLYDYDLVVLAAPLAWMAGQAGRTAWLPGEKWLLLALYLAPLGARAAGLLAGVAIAPLLILVLLLAIARRAARA